MKKRRFLKIGLITAAILMLTILLAGAAFTGKMVCDGILNQNAGVDTKQNSIGQLAKWGFDRETFHETYQGTDFEIASVDGNTIPGTCYRSAQETGKWVILVHGAGGDRECMIPLVGPYLEKGYHVLTYDQRGHGDNSDRRVSFGIFEKRDVRALVDYVRAELDAEMVILHGQSMGAQTAALYAATEHGTASLDALILDSPVPGLEWLMTQMFLEDGCTQAQTQAILTCGRIYSRIVAGMRFEDGDTIAQARKITVPCMVILSEKDNVSLPDEVEQLYDNLGSSDKLLMRVDSRHIEGVIDDPEQYFNGVFQFLDKVE